MSDRIARFAAGIGVFVDRVNRGLVLGLALSLLLLTVFGFIQVTSRYVFGAPLVWSEELIRILLIWIVFIGIGPAYRLGYLAAIETLLRALPDRIAFVLQKLTLIVAAGIWVTMIVFGWRLLDALKSLSYGTLEFPVDVVYAAGPVGACIALVNTIAMLIDGKVGEHRDES